MKHSTNLERYLARYSEDCSAAAALVQEHYQHVLCIPAFAEDTSLLQQLQNLPSRHVLVILVLNAPDSGATEQQLQRTADLAAHLNNNLPIKRTSSASTLLSLNADCEHDLLLLEYWQPGQRLPSKQGVGLARKLACDLACHLIQNGKLTTPWIHSSDADTRFPQQYFSATESLDASRTAAALYPFQHDSHGNSYLDQCQQLYDHSLHYYVNGLRWAGSPYAYHTIGSCLLLNVEHYVQVRGFPKRNAAEDFYLLNKLNKTGSIISLQAPILNIRGRLSDRVPFGTGPAVANISRFDSPLQEYRYYHPESFQCLKQMLEHLPLWYAEQHKNFNQMIINSISSSCQAAMQAALTELQLQPALQHACIHSQTLAGFLKHFHHWFDAFRSRKLIHLLRDNGLESLPLAKLQTQSLYHQINTYSGN